MYNLMKYYKVNIYVTNIQVTLYITYTYIILMLTLVLLYVS